MSTTSPSVSAKSPAPSTSNVPKVVVIGAGPVGLATAYGLKKQGFNVTVYDRVDLGEAIRKAQAEGTPVNIQFGETQGGAISMYTNGMTALRNLGLEEAVLAAPHCDVKEFLLMNMDGSDPIAHFNNKNTTSFQYLRGDIHGPIMRSCGTAGIKVFVGKKLIGLEETGEGVTVRFEDGTVQKADFVIGADGIHSTTRKLLFPDVPKPEFWSIGYIGVFERGLEVPGYAGLPSKLEFGSDMAVYGDNVNGNMVFCGNCSDKYGSWMVLERTAQSDDTSSTAEDRDAWRPTSDLPKESKRLAVAVEGWGIPKHIVDCIRHSSRITPLTIYDLPDMNKYHKGRVLLVGDAAHGTIPTIGQGLCSGLEDAVVLSDLFAEFGAKDYETVFKLFYKARAPRIEKVYKNARLVADRMKNGTPFKAKVGRVIMRTVFSMLSFFGVADELTDYDYKPDLQKVIAAHKKQK